MKHGRATLAALLLVASSASPAAAQSSPTTPPALRSVGDLPSRVDDAPSPRAQPDHERRRERLLFLLSGYEHFPTRDELGPTTDDATLSAELRAIAADTSLRPSLRARAVWALGYFDDDETFAALERLAEVDLARVKPMLRAPADAMRHRAIAAMARARGARALPALVALFDHADLQVRVSALRAAGSTGAPARATLRAQRALVGTDVEREAIDAALSPPR